ncbi:hypothetical protein Pcinc_020841 [Petrolisthes cinctipes]|uniref:Uncharacterized protein n=1 Tax=Petrolisthes cinctipes TaxID=88211 RepID=A0AAE1KJB7_PETCI|nr:hypothetical protein Pcinc_020841 [Petrolisthes cinctipes]
MDSIQAAVKEHIQGKLREISSTLDEERRELSILLRSFMSNTVVRTSSLDPHNAVTIELQAKFRPVTKQLLIL